MSRWPSQEERFAASYDKPPVGCWEWRRAVTSTGYGVTRWNGRREYAHRVMWMRVGGRIPDGLCVLHGCDNRRCIRPNHLFLGTKADNTADMWAKGRQRGPTARNAVKQTCDCHGLPLNEQRRCPRHYSDTRVSRSEANRRRWAETDPDRAADIRRRMWQTRKARAAA